MKYLVSYCLDSVYYPLGMVDSLNDAFELIRGHVRTCYLNYYIFSLSNPVCCKFIDGKIICA